MKIRPDRGGRGPSRAPHESEGNPPRIFEGSGGDPAKRPRPQPGAAGYFNRLLGRSVSGPAARVAASRCASATMGHPRSARGGFVRPTGAP